MRVAAFGRTRWLYDTILSLRDAGHQIVLIATCAAAPEYTTREHDFERIAAELDCRFICDASLNRPEYLELTRSLRVDIGVSVNWSTLIGAQMIESIPHGIVNAHAGDLPRFRGNACPNWAILSGEPCVVLTFHRMSEDLDAGPILLKKALPISDKSYIGDVYAFLDEAIPSGFVEAVDGLESGKLIPVAQSLDPKNALRCFPRLPEDGKIDWMQSAQAIAALVRASAEPFSGAYSYRGEEKLIVWCARDAELPYPAMGVCGQVVRIDAERGEVDVLAGEGVLVLEEIEIGSKRCKASEVIRSTRTRLGDGTQARFAAMQSRISELERKLMVAGGDQSA